LDFVRKRKWWIILPCFLIGPLGSVIIYKLPSIFDSSTVVLVEPQKLDPNFVRNPVSVNIKDRLNQIRNKILSSTNLDLIVKKFRLYEGQRIRLTDQAKVDLLRRRIEIYVDHPGGYDQSQVSYFSISYEDKSPEMAQAVAAEVAAQFLSEEERQSKERIAKTSGFIDNQLEENLAVLEAKKKELSQARLQGVVNMPFDAATYAKQLDTVETEISGVTDGIDRWQDKVSSLERELSTTPQTVTRQVEVADESDSAESVDEASPAQRSIPSSSSDIAALETELDRLKRSYTDEHPDVRRLSKRLETLRAQSQQPPDSSTTKPATSKPAAEPVFKSVTSPNPVYRRLTAQLAQAKRNLESQQGRLGGLEKQQADLHERLARWPQITQQIADKTAELNSLETQYNALKAKQQDARLSVELINKAQTEQFRIQDPANFPEQPVKPNRPRLFLLTWGLSLAVGVGLALARDLTDRSIRTPSDVTSVHPLSILVSIPTIQSERERISANRRRRYLVGLYAVSGASLVGILLFAVLNERIITWIVDYINVYVT
jgi:polysaccharide chain length determinant protein (PEP-CTERM system associated)